MSLSHVMEQLQAIEGAALTEQSVRTTHPSKYAKSAISPPILGVREEIFYRGNWRKNATFKNEWAGRNRLAPFAGVEIDANIHIAASQTGGKRR
jgi:hypothetical protein